MWETVKNAFKIKEIRSRIFFTFLILIVVRIGCQIPLIGIDQSTVSSLFDGFSTGAFSFFDALTGSSFSKMSIFALNITPYITASIIMQLLTIAIPKLEELQKEGEDGRKKIAKVTRYLTVGLSVVEGVAMAIGFGSQGIFDTTSTADYVWTIIVAVITMTAGSTLLMWMGEQITEKGIGNGISIILLVNILSRLPADFTILYEKFIKNASSVGGSVLAAVVIVAVVVAIVVFIVYLQAGERRIAVQYAKKMQGRKMVGGQSSHIPLRVNTAGVIPIIFASSLLQFPVIIANLVTGGTTPEWTRYFSSGYWCNPSAPIYSIGFLAYVLLVIFFAYFYTSITFNPIEVSDRMKKQGGFIPGIRPGKPTTEYLTKILNYIIFIGAMGLIIVAAIPIVFTGVWKADISFGGTSLIIIVGVILETMKKTESMMLVRNYKGFLRES